MSRSLCRFLSLFLPLFLCKSLFLSLSLSLSLLFTSRSPPPFCLRSVSIFLDFETCHEGAGILMLDFCQGLGTTPTGRAQASDHTTSHPYQLVWLGSKEQDPMSSTGPGLLIPYLPGQVLAFWSQTLGSDTHLSSLEAPRPAGR